MPITILGRVRRFLQRKFSQPPLSDQPGLTLAGLVMLTDDPAVMLTCDEVYALLEYYTERAARGEDVAHLMPSLHAHLEQCPNCRPLYQALLRMLGAG